MDRLIKRTFIVVILSFFFFDVKVYVPPPPLTSQQFLNLLNERKKTEEKKGKKREKEIFNICKYFYMRHQLVEWKVNNFRFCSIFFLSFFPIFFSLVFCHSWSYNRILIFLLFLLVFLSCLFSPSLSLTCICVHPVCCHIPSKRPNPAKMEIYKSHHQN